MSDLTHDELIEKVAIIIDPRLSPTVVRAALADGVYTPSSPLGAAIGKAHSVLAAIAEATKEPTEAMIDAGAQRLVRCGEGPATWPDSYDPLEVAGARQEAERVILSGIHASPLYEAK